MLHLLLDLNPYATPAPNFCSDAMAACGIGAYAILKLLLPVLAVVGGAIWYVVTAPARAVRKHVETTTQKRHDVPAGVRAQSVIDAANPQPGSGSGAP